MEAEMTSRGSLRGNALVVVLVAIAVMSLLAVGAIRFTGANRDAAGARDRAEKVASCTEVARKYLLSQLPKNALSPTATEINPADSTVQFERVLPDSTVASERSTAATAHYGLPARKATIVGVSPLAVGAARRQVRDVANSLGPGTLGGQYYRVVVRCIEPGTTRESELEFSFRYGI